MDQLSRKSWGYGYMGVPTSEQLHPARFRRPPSQQAKRTSQIYSEMASGNGGLNILSLKLPLVKYILLKSMSIITTRLHLSYYRFYNDKLFKGCSLLILDHMVSLDVVLLSGNATSRL